MYIHVTLVTLGVYQMPQTNCMWKKHLPHKTSFNFNLNKCAKFVLWLKQIEPLQKDWKHHCILYFKPLEMNWQELEHILEGIREGNPAFSLQTPLVFPILADCRQTENRVKPQSCLHFKTTCRWFKKSFRPSHKHLLVDPHERTRVVGFAFVFNAVEAVSPLAVIPLVVVVVLHLPHRFKHSRLCELKQKQMYHCVHTLAHTMM